MDTMKLFAFITISLIPTIYSSTMCKNQEVYCVALCCKKLQYYHYVSKKCEAIPGNASILWETLLPGNTTKAVKFVEFDGCKTYNYLFLVTKFCYSPYYNTELKQFGRKHFYEVPCDRLTEIPIMKIIAALYHGTLSTCLSIMVIYTCIKGLKERFIYKLYSWYLVSMLVFVLAIVAASKVSVKLLDVALYFFVSSWLWLNVIGFQMWSDFKQANAQYNSHNNQLRFICYSIFVWGISVILTILENYKLTEISWYLKLNEWIYLLITFFNLVTLVVLSVNICITRCGVINLTTETHFKRRLACLILRLWLMMGFSRLVAIAWFTFFHIGLFEFAIFFTLEPFVLSIVLLWKPKNCINWKLICCCCKKSEEISNAPEIVVQLTQTTNL